MKIGLSYSRCVRDIVDGTVPMEDVLIVISRTDFDPRNDEQWSGIWSGYHDSYGLSRPEWSKYPAEDEHRFRNVSVELWETGRLHQPRQFGHHPRRMPYYWLETVLPSNELDRNPMVKDAWEKFLTVAGLSNVDLEKNHQ